MKLIYDGLDYICVTDLKITRELNNHCSCKITFKCDEDNINMNTTLSLISSQFSLKYKDEDNEQNIFSGFVESVSYKKLQHYVYVTLECFTNSKQYDEEKKLNIFQETNKKIGDILKSIGYSSIHPSFFDSNDENKIIKNVIIQNDETDFQFTKRLLNSNGIIFMCESMLMSENLWIGKRKGNCYDYNENCYEIIKNKDVEYAKITAENIFYEIGDCIKLNSKEYIIIENRITLDNSTCICCYLLIENYDKLSLPETEIQKTQLIGEVTETKDKDKGGKIQIKFEADKKVSGGENYWFKQLTPYSTKDTGLFFTPAKGDKIVVDFQDGTEPLLLGTVRENKHDNFENPNELFIKNEFGKELNLKEKSINIVSVFDNIFLRLDEEKIEINNGKTGIYITKDNIYIQNEKGRIYLDDNILIEKKENGKIEIGENINLKAKESKIEIADSLGIDTKNKVNISAEKVIIK